MTDKIQNAPRAGTILYIEDNLANLKLVQVFLKARTQYELLSARDPREGLALAKAQRPELILLDINLPEMDGYEVLLALQADELTRDIPVLALSANAMPKDLTKAKQAGFNEYLTKPVDLLELNKHIDTYISST
jgi:CheY-like chemotaxis protein